MVGQKSSLSLIDRSNWVIPSVSKRTIINGDNLCGKITTKHKKFSAQETDAELDLKKEKENLRRAMDAAIGAFNEKKSPKPSSKLGKSDEERLKGMQKALRQLDGSDRDQLESIRTLFIENAARNTGFGIRKTTATMKKFNQSYRQEEPKSYRAK
jgi:hypothetical protein